MAHTIGADQLEISAPPVPGAAPGTQNPPLPPRCCIGAGPCGPRGCCRAGTAAPQPPRGTGAPPVPPLPLTRHGQDTAGGPREFPRVPSASGEGWEGGPAEAAPPSPPGSEDILFSLPRTKDKEERGTYLANSSPLAGTGGPEDGALLRCSPFPRPRAAPRPPGEGAARAALAAPAPLLPARPSPSRQPRSPPECRARLGPRALHPGRRPGVPRASGGQRAREPCGSCRCSPAILCRACEGAAAISAPPSPPPAQHGRPLAPPVGLGNGMNSLHRTG
ncbi:translation initiation factor IF-2-like [Manacus candei]|uniref:translation initiation factor IF-2-like n=1 Tax=Manacus candei TaxID=415023 RepID=UPI0022261D48|nr:translation initiation factor IF-2-like [Manacus candei]